MLGDLLDMAEDGGGGGGAGLIRCGGGGGGALDGGGGGIEAGGLIRCGGGGGRTDGGRILAGLECTPFAIGARGTGGNGPRGAPEIPAGGIALRGKVAYLFGGGGGATGGDEMSCEL